MKITNTSASVVVLVDLPAFHPGETRELPDALAQQLLTRSEFMKVADKADSEKMDNHEKKAKPSNS